MNYREIRQKFLDYFKARGHEIVPSSSLIPHDDPTLLFTNSGMVQFKRLFLGEEKRGYTRAASSQKCVRAGGKHNDLENVGYTARHHTFFEMLGNFSFGDYFKKEAIEWAWDLLTKGYGLPEDKLYVSVFKDDDEAYDIWNLSMGLPPERIVRLGEKDNFWAMGDTGPCGPCSEILIDQGEELGCDRPHCAPGCDCDRYLEIWNLVFTQFDRQPDGNLVPLPRPNIDTGMGLERLAAVVQGVKSNYETDIFMELIGWIQELASKEYGVERMKDVAFRVISDHCRAAAFLIGDGVMPSNEGRGYVLRRIIRRAVRYGQYLDLQAPFLFKVCHKVVDIMGEDYPELIQSREFIGRVVENEERRFSHTLRFGLKVLYEEIEKLRAQGSKTIDGKVAFKLYDTYGLSLDIVQDVARDEGLNVDVKGYEQEMEGRRRMSQESWKGSGEKEIAPGHKELLAQGLKVEFLGYEALSAESEVVALLVEGVQVQEITQGQDAEVVLDQTPFYGEAGGQVGDTGWLLSNGSRFRVADTIKVADKLILHKGKLLSGHISKGDTVKAHVDKERRQAIAINHTATHLLHRALRDTLGEHVKQAGSLVAPERLRFDFSHFTQVPRETIREIERIVNRRIRENHPVNVMEMTREEAFKTGAMAIFEERYGEVVRLVKIGEGISMELCGGTHTQRTGDIGLFRIVSEASVGANLRRIEALTGEAALLHDQGQDDELISLSTLLNTTPRGVLERVQRLLSESKGKDRQIEALKAKLLTNKSEDLLEGLREIGGIKVLAMELDVDSPKEMRESADRLKDKLKSGVILLGTRKDKKVMLTCVVTKDLVENVNAGEIIERVSRLVGGKGGGRADMAQGGGNKPQELARALEEVFRIVEEKVSQS